MASRVRGTKESDFLDKIPPGLALSMILMRENLKKSMIETMTKTADTQHNSPKSRNSVRNDCEGHACPDCGRIYKLKSSLRNHQKWECGKDPQFKCSFCSYKAKQKMHMVRHMERMHRDIDYSAAKTEVLISNENSQSD
ncbi:hypothetical protein HHI36_020007 [Cryptolaemus montrouzieri]|uniref:C2H2-type domain-containing protein n=1 Tax=Cryptolaemus montrouzieri TaxID=559131 RepID=A0ABD2N983_9CUCU